MNNVDIAKAIDGIAIIISAWGSFEAANASLNKYLSTLINEQRNPSDKEWNALIKSIEANQARINELAAQ
jgi:hypothetical protein